MIQRVLRVATCLSIVGPLVLAGCSSSSRAPAGGGGIAGGVKTVKPLEFKADAKAPAQALILGTDSTGGSTIVPLSGVENRVGIDIMWIRRGEGPATGGSSPVSLSTAPNPEGQVRVGVYEEVAGGLGAQWRAGVWLAAFVASTVLNKDLTDFKFSAEAGGHVDGASASALMTAGYLASMLGLPVIPETTMTGIINPDGTIGPVGGIPQKFTASIANGKKRLGYPIGMRYATDINTNQKVDLVQLARDQGAEAVEVSDVYAALTLITGKTVPRPLPVDEIEMAIEDEVVAALEAKYVKWHQMLAQEWTKLIELDQAGKLPQALVSLAVSAQIEAAAAEKLKTQGLAASAYHRIVRAWVFAAAATATWEILELAQNGDLIGAKAKLHEFEGLAVTSDASLRLIAQMKPDTMGGHLQMLSAFQTAISGWGFHTFASEFLAGVTRKTLEDLAAAPQAALATAAVGDQIVLATAPTTLAIARAVAMAAMSIEATEIEGIRSINYLCSLPNVRRMATSFQSAAGANLAYFDSLIIVDVAAALKISQEEAKVKFAGFEPDYLVGMMASGVANLQGLPATLKTEWGEASIAWGLFSLAASELSFFRTSLLISKWYSLGVENDPATGRPKSVEHERAFMNMLTWAERRARENARAAKVATGSIPVQARLRYQAARVLREGDLADKLQALEGFWSSSVYSQTAVMLARN